MSIDPHAARRDRVFTRVLHGPGASDPAVRVAAAEQADVPEDLRTLVDMIHDHAYRVTDDDVARVQAVHGDDRTFEIIVSAALGAARHRLLAGLTALEQA
jgi:hypothetical protein